MLSDIIEVIHAYKTYNVVNNTLYDIVLYRTIYCIILQ